MRVLESEGGESVLAARVNGEALAREKVGRLAADAEDARAWAVVAHVDKKVGSGGVINQSLRGYDRFGRAGATSSWT